MLRGLVKKADGRQLTVVSSRVKNEATGPSVDLSLIGNEFHDTNGDGSDRTVARPRGVGGILGA